MARLQSARRPMLRARWPVRPTRRPPSVSRRAAPPRPRQKRAARRALASLLPSSCSGHPVLKVRPSLVVSRLLRTRMYRMLVPLYPPPSPLKLGGRVVTYMCAGGGDGQAHGHERRRRGAEHGGPAVDQRQHAQQHGPLASGAAMKLPLLRATTSSPPSPRRGKNRGRAGCGATGQRIE